MAQTRVGKDYRNVTFRRAGNYVRFAGGNAKQRNQKQQTPQLQKQIDRRRKEIGI